MLVIKQKDCEYEGFSKGYHKLVKHGGDSIELVRQFKMILDDGSVEVYLPTGEHEPSFATLRQKVNAN